MKQCIHPLNLLPLIKLQSSQSCMFLGSLLPVFTPPVIIQAPVVTAALIRPLPSNCLMRGWSSNFCMPPCTDITSFGNSICHSLSISCRIASGLVSYDNRTYCRHKNRVKRFKCVKRRTRTYFRIFYPTPGYRKCNSLSQNTADAINEQASSISSIVQTRQFWKQVLERKQLQKDHGIPSYWHSDLETWLCESTGWSLN